MSQVTLLNAPATAYNRAHFAVSSSMTATTTLDCGRVIPVSLRNRILAVSAIGLVLAAAYHATALAWPAIDPTSSPGRHALFVIVNLAVGAGLWRRPRGFFWVFAALTAQQIHSHGRALLRVLEQQHRVHWESVSVLTVLPVILWLLWLERRDRHARDARSAASRVI